MKIDCCSRLMKLDSVQSMEIVTSLEGWKGGWAMLTLFLKRRTA
jgi:hypothetical protein